MKINKGFLLVEVMVGFVVSIALIFALVAYVERIAYYGRATDMLERAVSIGVQSMDKFILCGNKKDHHGEGPFSVSYSQVKRDGGVSRISCTVRWAEPGEQNQDHFGDKTITFWSTLLEE